MYTFLLIIVNFIIIFSIIKLTINIYSKFAINKFIMKNYNFARIKKIQPIFNAVIISSNLIFLFLNIYIQSLLLIAVISVIDIIAVIFLGTFVKLKNSLDK